MQASSRFIAVVALGGVVALGACGGSDVSPVASTTAAMGDDGAVASAGRGPGVPSSPNPAPGQGTCTSDCDGTGQGPGPGPGPMDGFCGSACSGPVGPDPADVGAILAEALQEEYKAEALYRSVLGTFGDGSPPFALVAQAEARHVEALQQMFARRQMTPPASAWTPASFPPFASIPIACAAGVTAEREDAAFYDKYLPRTDLPQDVRTVFTNLQRASLENHLPAFERCR